jgi:hypothetical protein
MRTRNLLIVVVAAFALFLIYRLTSTPARYGVLLSTTEVTASCGKPKNADPFKLIYDDDVRHTELTFVVVNHRNYLSHIQWQLKKGGADDIFVVDKDGINDAVRHQYLPSCLSAVIN